MEQDELTPTETGTSLRKVRLLWAGAFVSGLVATNLFISLFCSSWPLILYLVVGGVGAWAGEGLHRRFSADTLGSKIIRRGATALAIFSAVGLMTLFMMPTRWDTKCSWRYCGRALGPGLLKSPFPVGTPSCRGWSICVNEYPFSRSEYETALEHIEEQGCPAP